MANNTAKGGNVNINAIPELTQTDLIKISEEILKQDLLRVIKLLIF